VSASCGLCERDLPDGYLCPGDTLALAERLERLPKLFVELALYLQPGPPATGERIPTKAVHPGLPLNEAALDLRHGGIVLVLESWRSDIQSVRGWGEPATDGGLDRRVFAAARGISLQLEWIAADYPAAGDLAREVREMEGAALSVVGAKPDRGRRIGECVAVDPSGIVCGAVLRHKAGETRLICPWCTCVYEARDFLTLKTLQPDEAA
jgi:hypothetical protein